MLTVTAAHLWLKQLSAYTESILCYFLFPWTFTNVAYSLRGASLGHVAIAYSFLCSVLYAGRILGRAVFKSFGGGWILKGGPSSGGGSEQQPLLSFLLLTVALKGIASVTRYSVLVCIYFSVGILAVKIGSYYEKCYGLRSSASTFGIIRQIAVSPQSSASASSSVSVSAASAGDLETELYIKMKIVAFIFTTLLSSLLYGNVGDSSVAFPAASACSWLSAMCFGAFVLNVVSNRSLLQRIYLALPFRSKTSSFVSSRNSSGNGRGPSAPSQSSPTPALRGGRTRSTSSAAMTSDDVTDDVSVSVAPSIAEAARAVPPNFLRTAATPAAAKRAYAKALKWRREHRVDTILTTRQDHFHDILQLYPHALHGYALDGCAVAYELLGQAKPKEMRTRGITPEHLTWHFLMRNELLFQRFGPHHGPRKAGGHSVGSGGSGPDSGGADNDYGRMMTVLDVKGVSVSDISTDVLSFIKQSSHIMDTYYPGRVARLVICNAPSWFHSVWSLVARVLPEAVQKKITIIAGVDGLDAFIERAQRPAEYGGTDPSPLRGSPQHLAFLGLAAVWDRQDHGGVARDGGVGVGIGAGGGAGGGAGTGHAIDEREKDAFLATKIAPIRIDTKPAPKKEVIRRGRDGQDAGDAPTDVSPSSTSTGLFGWMRGGGSGGQQAYLGEKNSYRFDPVTATWKFDADTAPLGASGDDVEAGDAKSAGGGDGAGAGEPGDGAARRHRSREEVEEHGLVLAIQAAHLASQQQHRNMAAMGMHAPGPGGFGAGLGKNPGADGSVDDHGDFQWGSASTADDDVAPNALSSLAGVAGLTGVGDDAAYDPHAHGSERDGSDARCGDRGRDRAGKMSPHVFLLVITMYFLACMVESGLFALLPVWFTSPVQRGGLGYTVVDIGLAVSGGGVVLLLLVETLRQRLSFVLKSSPLRAMRIGCGAMVVCCFLLPNLLCSPRPPSTSLSSLTAPAANAVQGNAAAAVAAAATSATLRGARRIPLQVRRALFQCPSYTSPNSLPHPPPSHNPPQVRRALFQCPSYTSPRSTR